MKDLEKYFIVEYKERNDPFSVSQTIVLKDKDTKEELFSWNDDIGPNAPEDMIWHRGIGKLFLKAFELGLKKGGK